MKSGKADAYYDSEELVIPVVVRIRWRRGDPKAKEYVLSQVAFGFDRENETVGCDRTHGCYGIEILGVKS